MNLKQPGFMYSACKPFTKNKPKMQKLKETGYSRYIYRNEIDKAYFQHYMAYGDFKGLPWRLTKYCVIRHLKLLVIPSMMDVNVD